MRSRTSRGVPEWSGGKDLYMGSPILATKKCSGFFGIIPGPPKGFRGSTRRVHQPRRALWAVFGREPAPKWAGRHPLGPMRPGFGGTLKGAPPWIGGQAPSPWPIRPPNACRGLRNTFRSRWSSPSTPRTIPDSNTLRPIYRSSPPDHSGTPRHVRDLIRDSEQPSVTTYYFP